MKHKNTVELLGYYGSDEIIACSAWTSTSRELSEDKKNRIPKLIETLWANGHETPFEKGVVHFLVDTDIASHIHFLKHRISSFNGESARYKELKEDKYYLPQDWSGINANTSALMITDDIGNPTDATWLQLLEQYTKMGNALYHDCVRDLEPVLGRKRAKESARFFKTYNSQIQGDVMFNMRSFANFLKLRLYDPRGDKAIHAQKEIAEIAEKMLDAVRNIDGNPFEATIKAWGY